MVLVKPCRLRRELVGLVVSMSFAACSNLTGLSDFTVEQGAAGGTSAGGQSASGGSSQGGTSGAGGGVACAPVMPPGDIVRACVLAAGCSPNKPIATMSRCISRDILPSFGGTACLATVSSCAAAALCTGYSYVDSPFCQGKSGWVCDGDIARFCSASTSYQVDCQKLGGTCALPAHPSDAAYPCKVVDHCTETGADFHCAGAAWYQCIDGVGYGQLCSASSAQCKTLGSGAQCVYVADTCSGAGTVSCKGDSIDICTDDGLPVKYDCSRAGLACASPTPARGECLAPGCTVGDVDRCQEACDGTKLTTCVGGAPYTLDCADYDFPMCRETQIGNPPVQAAYCSFF